MSHINYNMGGQPGPEDLGALHSQLWSALRVLDGPAWASASAALAAAAEAADRLIACSDITCDQSIRPEDLLSAFEEESVHFDGPPELLHMCISWIWCKLKGMRGRAEIRTQISHYFAQRSGAISPTRRRVVISEDFHTPLSPMDHPAAVSLSPVDQPAVAAPRYQAPSVHVSDSDILKSLDKAKTFAQGFPIQKFNGIDQVERYFKFKYEVSQILVALPLATAPMAVETICNLVTGEPLLIVRKESRQLYSLSVDQAVDMVWARLDALYSTPEASRYVSSLWNNIKQIGSETVQSYVARFRHVLAMQREAQSEQAGIVRFSSGLIEPIAQVARGLVDAQRISELSPYITTFLSVYQSLAPLRSAGNAIGMNSAHMVSEKSRYPQKDSACFRCGSHEHMVADCDKKVLYPCQKCNSYDHFTRVCPVGDDRQPPGRKPQRRAPFKKRVGFNPKPAIKQFSVDQSPVSLNGDSDIHNELMQSMTMSSVSVIATDSPPADVVELQSIHNELVDCISTEVPPVQMSAIGFASIVAEIADPNVVDPFPPMVTFSTHNQVNIEALNDTGAAASFMSLELAKELRRKGAYGVDDIERTKPLTVVYGNGSSEQVSSLVRLQLSLGSSTHKTAVFVSRGCNPAFIAGRPALYQFGLLSRAATGVANSDVSYHSHLLSHDLCSVYSETSHNAAIVAAAKVLSDAHDLDSPRPPLVQLTSANRFLIRYPLLEMATVSPYRAPRRSRSTTDYQILLARLDKMSLENKIERCSVEDCHIVNELVLVDKSKTTPMRPRVFPDEEVHNRYRITLDLRVANQLDPVKFAECYGLVPNPSVLTKKPPKTIFDRQSQPSIFALVQACQTIAPKFFVRVDVSDAFQGIEVPKRIRSLFTTCVLGRYFRWTTLPQGWRWSPLYFNVAMAYVVDKVNEILQAEISSPYVCRHYVDDILIATSDKASACKALEILRTVLSKYGFHTNPTKCQIAEEVVFCGYVINENGVTIKSDICDKIIQDAWSRMEAAKSLGKKRDECRSWCGVFNYFRNFLLPELQSGIHELYRLTTAEATLEDFEEPRIKDAFFSLYGRIRDGLPYFQLSCDDNVLCSLIIVDANVHSWSSVLLRVVAKKSTQSHLVEVEKDVMKLLGIDTPISLLPVQFCGHAFSRSEQRQSSTYRERLSQLLAVRKLIPLLSHEVFVVTDNINATNNWHELEEALEYGGTMTDWVRFCSVVSKTLWLRRDNALMSFVDRVARVIAEDATPVKKPPPVSKQQPVTVASISMEEGEEVENTLDNDSRGKGDRMFLPPPDIVESIISSYGSDMTKYQGVSLREIYEYLCHKKSENKNAVNLSRRFFLNSRGLMYHVRVIGDPQVYAPSDVRSQILYTYHDSHIGLHCGHEKLVQTISQYYFWPAMSRDALCYVKSCKECLAKVRVNPFQGDISSAAKSVSEPFVSWTLDHCGPFEPSADGHKYILVCVCNYSNIVKLVAVPDTTASATASAFLTNIVSSFGFCEQLLTDRGSGFASEVFRDLMQLCGVSHRMSASYTPRVQGRAERVVAQIKTIVATTEHNVFEMLPFITLYHNSHYVGNSKVAPFEVIYGTNVNTTPLSTYKIFSESSSEDINDPLYKFSLIRKQWDYYRRRAFDTASDYYASKSNDVHFSVGDKVYRVFSVTSFSSPKTRITGPHQILHKVSAYTYAISGIPYNIPAYQLQPMIDRVDQVPAYATENLQHDSPIVGDIVAYSVVEDDGLLAYEIGRVFHVEDDTLTIQCYWMDSQRVWAVWEGLTKSIHSRQLILPSVVLTRGSRLRGEDERILRSRLDGKERS